jgi:hypothetical protein
MNVIIKYNYLYSIIGRDVGLWDVDVEIGCASIGSGISVVRGI